MGMRDRCRGDSAGPFLPLVNMSFNFNYRTRYPCRFNGLVSVKTLPNSSESLGTRKESPPPWMSCSSVDMDFQQTSVPLVGTLKAWKHTEAIYRDSSTGGYLPADLFCPTQANIGNGHSRNRLSMSSMVCFIAEQSSLALVSISSRVLTASFASVVSGLWMVKTAWSPAVPLNSCRFCSRAWPPSSSSLGVHFLHDSVALVDHLGGFFYLAYGLALPVAGDLGADGHLDWQAYGKANSSPVQQGLLSSRGRLFRKCPSV